MWLFPKGSANTPHSGSSQTTHEKAEGEAGEKAIAIDPKCTETYDGADRTKRWLTRVAIAMAVASAVSLATIWLAVRLWDFPLATLDPSYGSPLIIVDRHGEILRKVPATKGQSASDSWLPLEEIPPLVIATFIASEDKHFFEHHGVDWRGVARAAWLNLKERRVGYGGSTITMQLVRMVKSGSKPRTLARKIAESIWAMRLERAVGKRDILEQYLNRAYFGRGAYGIEAAARTYFDKPARALSSGEATLLAILPRAPSAYDLIRHWDAAQARREHVFLLLKSAGIMTDQAIEIARVSTPTPTLHAATWQAKHFTDHILTKLPISVRQRGGTVHTTLDATLQRQLEKIVATHVNEQKDHNLDQAGVVVLDTQSGAVRAMVGSAGWNTKHGQINIVTRRRHPGSALKPFIYALALESGAYPGTIAYDIADVPSNYQVIWNSQHERGPVRFREALAGSYNLAAVHTLEQVGVATLLDTLKRAGIGSLNEDPENYGLRLALGSARVKLIDLASAYGFIARSGTVVGHHSIERVESASAQWRPSKALPHQLFSPQTAWLIMNILSDPNARRPEFGNELPVDMGVPIAIKTGTSRGFADTVTIAVTEQLTVAAWAGNFDGEPTQGLIAMKAAAPQVRAGLLAAADRLSITGAPIQYTLPPAPLELEDVEICPLSGMRRGPHCPHRLQEKAAPGHLPQERCNWHQAGGGVIYPAEIQAWAKRQHQQGGRQLTAFR